MIDSLHNVKENFFKVFMGDDFSRTALSLSSYDGIPFSVPIRYAKDSSLDYTEAEREQYPIIAIEDFLPVPRPGWVKNHQARYGAIRDTDNDGVDDTITEFPEPVPFNCRYEVSIATKSEKQFLPTVQWVYNTFDITEGVLLFNKVSLPDNSGGPIGDYVGYTLEYQDSPRTDGIFEAVFSFTLKPYVVIKDQKDHALLTKIVLNYNGDQTNEISVSN